MNYRQIFKLLGGVNLFLCGFMAPPLVFGLIEGRGWAPFALTVGLSAGLWVPVLLKARGVPGEVTRREGFALVVLVWLSASFFGALPFHLSGEFGSFTNAFFESVSGYTTTGATILPRVSHLPRSILLWRSMIQWLGGMGIVLLSMAILPLLGFGAVQLFKAEMPGPSMERIRPRIRATATLLWWVYAIITGAAAVCLFLAGMRPFDAVCHALTALATGGFSTHDAGIPGFASPAIEWVLTLFMLVAGCNFVLHYRALKGRWRSYGENEEFRWYMGFFGVLSLALFVVLALHHTGGTPWERVRHSMFQVASMMTTTGYHSADYEQWQQAAPAVFMLLVVAMFLGGMGGSTAGGIKTARVIAYLKLARNGLRGLAHPRALLRLRVNGVAIPDSMLKTILAFLCLHVSIFLGVSMAMAMMELDVVTALSATAACLNNIGPGFGGVGPADNYAFIPALGKWVLMAAMLIGRLELFTILVLATPAFWRR